MNERIRSYWRRLVKFHRDEEGMEAIQVVAIVALAAIVLVVVKTKLWPKIERWAQGKTDELTG